MSKLNPRQRKVRKNVVDDFLYRKSRKGLSSREQQRVRLQHVRFKRGQCDRCGTTMKMVTHTYARLACPKCTATRPYKKHALLRRLARLRRRLRRRNKI